MISSLLSYKQETTKRPRRLLRWCSGKESARQTHISPTSQLCLRLTIWEHQCALLNN
uniref:Uncharacterized protein n=1 Tax=Bos indicus x Bos taurus TaxID=30522 RepID=A0A4W2FP62_BOBOX